MNNRTPHPRTVLPAAERADRNRRIAEARATGLTWRECAERFDVSVMTARRAAAEHAATAAPTADPESIDADALVHRVVRAHVRALDRLDRLPARLDNHSAEIGASRAYASVSVSLLGVLYQLGLLADPALARYYAEMGRAGRALYAFIEQHDIPWEDAERVFGDVPLVVRFAREAVAA